MMASSLLIKKSAGLLLMVLLLQSQSQAFMTDILYFIPALSSGSSTSHEEITRLAILQTTAGICRAKALMERRDFAMPATLTEDSLTAACGSPDSAKGFRKSIGQISEKNAWVDVWYMFSAKHHFDDQTFIAGRDVISSAVNIVKESVKKQSYEVARQKLGRALHTLQDFYSHSNWIELGNTFPYSNLIRPDTEIKNIAESATCRSCNGNDCTENILPEILTEKKLTSGYFGLIFSSKPPGKCSHGGSSDRTSGKEPTGGINKDHFGARHGFLHLKAVQGAINATRELLEDIRAVVGDSEFLRLMGFTQASVLCFVVDTTGSMGDDIAEVIRITSLIIDSKNFKTKNTEYILVPFNDPDFGPLTRTTDPDLFKSNIRQLTPSGGGDGPEMSLSGLQLALTGSPPQTEIFVFTDADAKDKYLKSTVLALMERTKSVVSFMLTNALTARRRRSIVGSQNDQQQFSSRTSSLNDIYQELAQASGGQAIEVTKSTLSQATSIIVDASSSSTVTVFQAVRSPGKAENFTFIVDSSLHNLTVYITGTSPTYTITSPTGISQSSAVLYGALGLINIVGNFQNIRPDISNPTGQWIISIDSTQPYTVKVVGQSGIDFLFNFVEISNGSHPSYAVLNSRPTANSNVSLLVTMVGGDSVRLTAVALVEASGSNSVNGTLTDVGNGKYFVTISNVPAGEFLVRVVGEDSSTRASDGVFQRQSSTRLQASTVTITTLGDGTLEPGKSLTVPFTVATNGSGGIFNINVSNDRSFEMTNVTSTLTLESGGSANGTVTLAAPGNINSGSDVTLTIQAEAPGATDTNYAILRISVVAPPLDITPPVCSIVSVNANCSGNCSLSSWDLSANMTDRNGSGIQRVAVRQGLGTLNTSTVVDGGENVTVVFYNASCCSPQVDLVVADSAGNVGSCSRSVYVDVSTATSVPPANLTTNPTTLVGATVQTSTNGAERCLSLSVFFWLTVGIISLYQL